MSHLESVAFFEVVAAANASLIDGASILEVGSFDVNGGIRGLFSAAQDYTGVDLCEGPGVDCVSSGHELRYPDGSFDISLSSECFEHNPYWRETFLNMTRMTRRGGLVAFSCASRGRVEHGTGRTDPIHSPGTQSRGLDYYRNLEQSDFLDLDLEGLFSSFRFWYLPSHFDLCFVGIRRSEESTVARIPNDSEVQRLNGLMSRPYKAVTTPFRFLSKIVPESKYQSFAVPLSKFLAPAIIFLEYRRNTQNFSWTYVAKGLMKRLRTNP